MIRAIQMCVLIVVFLILSFIRKRYIEPNKDNKIVKRIRIVLYVLLFFVVCASIGVIFFG